MAWATKPQRDYRTHRIELAAVLVPIHVSTWRRPLAVYQKASLAIVFGQAVREAAKWPPIGHLEKAFKIAEGFWPAARRPAKMFRAGLYARRFHQRPADRPIAGPCPEGVRRPARLDDNPSGQGGRQRCIPPATAREVVGGGARSRNRRGAGVAVGPMGAVGGGPAGNAPGTGAPRRRFRVTHRSPGSDDARGTRDGGAVSGVCRV